MYEKAILNYINKHGFGQFSPKAVLFDMDGVCYDSMPNHASAWHKSMASYGFDMPEAAAFRYEGMRGTDIIRSVVKLGTGREISEPEAQTMYDEKARLFGLLPEPPIMDGVIELMRSIKDAGLAICVVTGSGQKPLIRRLLSDFGEFIDDSHLITAFDVKHGKPAPDPYLMGLDKAGGLQPWEGIVVENAPFGVKAGAAAGIFTIAVNSGPLPDEALSCEGADVVLPRMSVLRDSFSSLMAAAKNLS